MQNWILVKRIEKIQMGAERERKNRICRNEHTRHVEHKEKVSHMWNWDSRWRSESEEAIIKYWLLMKYIKTQMQKALWARSRIFIKKTTPGQHCGLEQDESAEDGRFSPGMTRTTQSAGRGRGPGHLSASAGLRVPER